MSEELKPCPFCGGAAKIVWQSPGYRAVACCINDECVIGPNGDTGPYCFTTDEWNHRPAEDAHATLVSERDALRARVARLEAERDRLREALEAAQKRFSRIEEAPLCATLFTHQEARMGRDDARTALEPSDAKREEPDHE